MHRGTGCHILESPEQPVRVACVCFKAVLHLYLVLFIVCSLPNRLIHTLTVCPASGLRAAVQGVRPGTGFQATLLGVEAAGTTEVERH